ncbi:MAG TPA: sensor histidine kinase [Chitinophagaceae bacterium]|nr:sensor histidine kinase [Chitinophagaceae bacterium]
MKKIFSLITLLISLSLIGIILLQVSWIRNMVLVRQEQVKYQVVEVVKQVTDELMGYKGGFQPANPRRSWLDGLGWEPFSPQSVASRYSVEDIDRKFRLAFRKSDLPEITYEFGLASFDRMGYNVFEKVSPGFLVANEDTINNFRVNRGFTPFSGTVGENLGASEVLLVVVPDLQRVVLRSLRWNIAASILFTLIIILAFYVTVKTLLQQKKLSEIKNDFINNMTHEFKTPLATISLAVDAMRNEKVIQDRERLAYFNGIIKEENLRMNRQVETILKASQLERNEIELNMKPVSLHEIVQQVAANFALQLDNAQGQITLQLQASGDRVVADEVHLSNLINNLIDNAIKYAKEGVPPRIRMVSSVQGKQILLCIEDNGMGMSRDTLKRIFEKFYRAHTGNRHNVKGFGLGLSYVKSVTEAMGGQVKADSTLGKGSQFTIIFPLATY